MKKELIISIFNVLTMCRNMFEERIDTLKDSGLAYEDMADQIANYKHGLIRIETVMALIACDSAEGDDEQEDRTSGYTENQ